MDTDSLSLLSLSMPSPAGADINAYAFEKNGFFSLTDNRTCGQPRRTQPCPTGCNREILRIHTTVPLTIVNFDEWQHDTEDSTCDYLIFDSGNNKKQFAFCELTCSLGKYVDSRQDKTGKRAKAHSQMVETWKLISESANPVFQANILRYVTKIGIFGWRDRENGNTTGAMRSPKAFTRTPSSTAGILRFSDYTFGENFNFIQVKYPHIFPW